MIEDNMINGMSWWPTAFGEEYAYILAKYYVQNSCITEFFKYNFILIYTLPFQVCGRQDFFKSF